MPNKTQQPRPTLDTWASVQGWSTNTDRTQFEEDFNAEGCQHFADAHSHDFPFCEAYATRLKEFLGSHPLSRKNLEIAWAELDLGRVTQVETPPEPKTIGLNLNPVVAAQVSPASEEESEALEKVKDVPYLHDSQRKIRDLKLRAAAIESRNAHRKHHSSVLIG
jgi:hypothetical protein